MLKPTVYFLFDSMEQIIYIGSSINLKSRIAQHKNTKDWFCEVASIGYKEYKNKDFMLKWEKLFILDLSPKYNKKDRILRQEDSENLFEDQLVDIIKNKISIQKFFIANLEDGFNKSKHISKEEKKLKTELRRQKRINRIIESYKEKGYEIVELCTSEAYSINLFDAPFDFNKMVFRYHDAFIKFKTLSSNQTLNNMSTLTSIELIKRFLFNKEKVLIPRGLVLSLEKVTSSGFGGYNLFQKITVNKDGYLIDIQWSDYQWLTIDNTNIYVNIDMLVKEIE